MAENIAIDQAKEALRHEVTVLEDRLAKYRQALKTLDELEAFEVRSSNGASPVRVQGIHAKRFQRLSMVKAAAIVLSEAKQPLHVSDIMERMIQGGFKPGTPESFRMSLVGSLDRGSKADQPGWFYKSAPATYGLRDVQAARIAREKEKESVPA